MTESASKDSALRDILDRLLHEIDDVIALIGRPLTSDLADAGESVALDCDATA